MTAVDKHDTVIRSMGNNIPHNTLFYNYKLHSSLQQSHTVSGVQTHTSNSMSGIVRNIFSPVTQVQDKLFTAIYDKETVTALTT